MSECKMQYKIDLTYEEVTVLIHRLSELRIIDLHDDEVLPLKSALKEFKKAKEEYDAGFY